MKKSFGFKSQLQIGKMGVQVAKAVFRGEGYEIVDYETDKGIQTRGIDLYVKGLGFVEVKTDTHACKNVFLELSVSGKPGAVDRCTADYYAVLYVYYGKMFLFPRPALQQWLREHHHWIKCNRPDWVKHISSHQNGSSWMATGVVVPLNMLIAQIKENVKTIRWDVDKTVVAGEWKEEKK